MANSLSKVLRSRLFSNILNQFLLYGFSHILPFLLMPYLLATIGIAKYGLINFAIAFSFYFQVLNEWGFDLSNVRHVVKNRDNPDELSRIFMSILACKTFLLCCSLVVYSSIIIMIPKFRQYELLYILAFVRLIGVIITPYWLFRSMEDMKFVTRISLVVKCLCIIPIFLIVKTKADFEWVMFFFALEALVSGMFAVWIAKVRYGLHYYSVKFTDIKFFFEDSLPFFTSVFLTRVYQTSNTFILGLFCGETVTGIYSAAEKLHNAYASLVAPLINHIFYPYFSRVRNFVRMNKMVFSLIGLNALILVVIYLVSPILVPLFIKTETVHILNYFNLFLLLLLFSMANELIGFPYLGVFGKIKEVKQSTVLASSFYLIGVLLMILFKNINIPNMIYLLILTNVISLVFRGVCILSYRKSFAPKWK